MRPSILVVDLHWQQLVGSRFIGCREGHREDPAVDAAEKVKVIEGPSIAEQLGWAAVDIEVESARLVRGR
jgi:hypothetical protein